VFEGHSRQSSSVLQLLWQTLQAGGFLSLSDHSQCGTKPSFLAWTCSSVVQDRVCRVVVGCQWRVPTTILLSLPEDLIDADIDDAAVRNQEMPIL